jgi:Nuclease-related domain
MIEGGNAGGSALTQASQRRATAERLITEATWLEQVASDERAMAQELSALPETYTILHDLKVPGSKGNIDHVVIGPGGAFLVITRRHEEGVAFRDNELFVGATPMKADLEAARQEAQMLAQTLGTPVVPVLGLFGAAVPTSVPPAIDGVLVTPADQTSRVIIRAAHTLMPTPKIAAAAERALPLLNSPGTTPRVLVAAASRHAIPPPPVAPVALAMAPTAGVAPGSSPAEAQARSDKAQRAADQQERRRNDAATNPVAKLFRNRTGGKKSAAFVAASIGSLCLVAFAVGSLVRVLWPSGDDTSASSITTLVGAVDSSTTTTIFIAAPSLVSVASTVPVAAVPAPVVGFTPVCAAVGSGWTLVPNWPGDLAGLSSYQLEVQLPDGTWSPVGAFASADTAAASIGGQGPGATVTVQIVALMADGSRSPGTPTAVIAPATAC